MDEDRITEGLSHGDPEAFREFYRALAPGLVRVLHRVVGRKEMAEELTQDALLKALDKIGFYRPIADGSLRAWTFRIATNLALDSLRREKKRGTVERIEFASVPSPEHHAGLSETRGRLERAFSRLPAQARLVFLLREQEGLSALEISRVTGLSTNAVKQALWRVRERLKRDLGGEEGRDEF